LLTKIKTNQVAYMPLLVGFFTLIALKTYARNWARPDVMITQQYPFLEIMAWAKCAMVVNANKTAKR
jgi:hypothetical protein